MFKVINWDISIIISSHTTLAAAKRACRSLGHTSEGNPRYYAPVAYVGNEKGEVIYNPRFSKATN